MSYILHINTSTSVFSICVSKKTHLIHCYEIDDNTYSHSELINSKIIDLLKLNNLKFSDLNAVSISIGPGSYTGLRIGLSTAKAICYGLNIPLISIDTLHSLAYSVIDKINNNNTVIIPMIDARRNEVFLAHYDYNLHENKSQYNLILDDNSFSEIKKEIIICGNANEKCKKIINNNSIKYYNTITSAKDMIQIAYEKFINKKFENIAYTIPNYGKEFYTNFKK